MTTLVHISSLRTAATHAAELLARKFRQKGSRDLSHIVVGGTRADTAPLQKLLGSNIIHVELTVSSVSKALGSFLVVQSVGSVTILEGLEDDPDASISLALLAEFAQRNIPVVVCAANICRFDYGLKIALGCLSSVPQTFRRNNFDFATLRSALKGAGLHVSCVNDVRGIPTDPADLADQVTLSDATSVGRLFRNVIDQANPHGHTTHFVWLCQASSLDEVSSEPVTERPFISIVVRTQGTRPHTFTETLLSLNGQSNTDFEVLVMGHKLSEEARVETNQIIAEFPEWFRNKLRVIEINEGGRTLPLNEGFRLARGMYVCFLDDDDIVFSNYVDTFQRLSLRAPGCVLRSLSVTQDSDNVEVRGQAGLAAHGPFERRYMPTFDLFVHLRLNQSPFMTLAFPRGAYHLLNYRFDETLMTTEDWDFLMRVAAILGVADSSTITAVYRWWITSESSRTMHTQAEWDANRYRVYSKLDNAVVLFPPRTTERIRYLLNAYDESHSLRAADYPLAVSIAKNIVELYKAKLRTENRKSLLSTVFSRSESQEDWDITDLELVAKCGLFDADWYLEQNPDVRESGYDACRHYVEHGGKEGRCPGPHFNAPAYLKMHPDVKGAGLNPLVHYLRWGVFEGRNLR
jgi:glycosyltransferase involved in cell wall biosynthesis